MCQNYGDSEKNKITFEWMIKDFQHYINLPCDVKRNYVLSSSLFSPVKNGDGNFYLQIQFHTDSQNADDPCDSWTNVIKVQPTDDDLDESVVILERLQLSPDWLSFFLCWNKPTRHDTLMVKFSLHVFDNEKNKCYEENYVTSLEGKDKMGSDKFIKINDLKKYLNRFDSLILGCGIIVFEKPVNSPSTCEPSSNNIGDRLYNDRDTSGDYTLIVNNTKFKVHKLILMTSSAVFRDILDNNGVDNKLRQVKIDVHRQEIFEVLLRYIYTQKLHSELNKTDTMDLLAAAKKYELRDLKDLCTRLLNKWEKK